MDYRWDLKKIYSCKEEFYSDMTLVRDLIKKISVYREIKVDGSSLYELMEQCFKIRELNSKTLLYASLNYYLDIKNNSFIKMKEQAEELDLLVNTETSFIDELLSIIDIDKIKLFYEECPELEKFSFYISNVSIGKDHLDNEFVYKNNLDINKNIIKYNNLFSNMSFGMIDNVLVNNSNIGKYLINDDRNIRKEAFLSINREYKSKENDYFFVLKSLVDLRKDNALKKNFKTVLESELFNENIENSFLNNLINIVNNNISLMNRYIKLKMDYLKINDPSLYDINVSTIEIFDSYSIEDALDILKDLFKRLGDDYFNTFEYLLSNNYLDLVCDDKKHPTIVFSWNNYSFMNYRNRYIDLKNLAHEFGHIINNYLSKDLPFIYNDSNVFVGEVASLVNEILLNEYLYEEASDKNKKIFYLTKIIENFISQVYRQIMYTEFENILYNSNELSLDYINESYLSLVNKYYGNVLEVSESACSEWMRVGHLFRWNYYVYKYASGYVLAFNVVKKIKDNKYSHEYIDFLSSGNSCSNVDLLKKLNIDLYSEELIVDSFKLLNDYILELEKLLGVK